MQLRPHGLALALAVSLAAPAAASAASPPDPAWWAPNASLRQLPAPPAPGPPDAGFAAGLSGWTLRGPGQVSVRAGGPVGRFAAIRDNTTLVSSPWHVPATAQVLVLHVRGLSGRERLRVVATPVGGAPAELGAVEPGVSWSTRQVNALAVAGRTVRLTLDPVMGFGEGIDVAAPGRAVQVAPAFTLLAGAGVRSLQGPGSPMLVAAAGPLRLRGRAFAMPADAATLSVWSRAAAGTAPVFTLSLGGSPLGQATAGPRWAALRVPVAGLRGRRRVEVESADAEGLQLALVGTVQRRPALRLSRPAPVVGSPSRRVVRLRLTASTALAGRRVAVEAARPAGWARIARPLLDARGRGAVTVVAGAHPLRLRAVWLGSEQVAPGSSVIRTVRRHGT